MELHDGADGRHIALHAADLADVVDAAAAVGETLDLDHEVDGLGDDLHDGIGGHVRACSAHLHEVLQAVEGGAGIVRVRGRERAVMARVHGLEHVESLWSSALADDDAVGALAQRVDDQLLERDLALALVVGGAGLERQDVALRQVELGRCPRP